MNKGRKLLSLLALWLAIMSCNLPSAVAEVTPGANSQDQTATSSVPIGQIEITPAITQTTHPSSQTRSHHQPQPAAPWL